MSCGKSVWCDLETAGGQSGGVDTELLGNKHPPGWPWGPAVRALQMRSKGFWRTTLYNPRAFYV